MILMSIQTTHTENISENGNGNEKEKENSSPNAIDDARPSSFSPPLNHCPVKNCFVCGSADSDSFINMGSAVSVHSKKNIAEFVWGFLKKPSARTDAVDADGLKQNVICNGCLTLINQFDAANEIAMEFGKKVTESLVEMETKHQQAQNEPNNHAKDTNDMQLERDGKITVIDLCDD